MFPTTTTSSSGNDSSGVRVLLEAKMKQGAQMHPEEQPFGESGKTGREGHNVICTPPLLVTGCTHVRGPAIQRTYWVITQLMRLAPSVDSLLISV